MNSALLLLICMVAFAGAYRIYLRWIARVLEVSDRRATPAHTRPDGVDYCAAKIPVLLGHHFSSIAGAGPIVGPIAAAAYGWAPVAIWVIFGAVFFGAVHDLMALVASVRHEGRSIGEVIQQHMGTLGKTLFLLFCIFSLVLVIAVFAAVVATTFVESPATVMSSLLYMVLALAFGILVYRCGYSFVRLTWLFAPLLALSVWAGVRFPLALPAAGVALPGLALRLSPQTCWVLLLLVYCFIASVTPVWILLQPRDYLSSFLLYALIAFGVVGVLVTQPPLQIPAFTTFAPAGMGPLFPLLFVTVACGAISGFHSLVASGTSSKQLDRESDALPVGAGAMLIEGVLAIVALITAARLSTADYATALQASGPINVFARGIGACVAALGIRESLGTTFGALAVSAFALTTLDTSTRLCRFCVQELFAHRGRDGRIHQPDRYSTTAVCIIAAAALAVTDQWKVIWPVFGSANQLLAALTLATLTLWLAATRKPLWMAFIPMIFMFTVTIAALCTLCFEKSHMLAQAWSGKVPGATRVMVTTGVLAGVSLLLLGLALVLLLLSCRTFLRLRRAARQAA